MQPADDFGAAAAVTFGANVGLVVEPVNSQVVFRLESFLAEITGLFLARQSVVLLEVAIDHRLLL